MRSFIKSPIRLPDPRIWLIFTFCLSNLKHLNLNLSIETPFHLSSHKSKLTESLALSLVYEAYDFPFQYVDWISKSQIQNPRSTGSRSNPQIFLVLYQNQQHAWIFYSVIITILGPKVVETSGHWAFYPIVLLSTNSVPPSGKSFHCSHLCHF